jgi:hypothetical protein
MQSFVYLYNRLRVDVKYFGEGWTRRLGGRSPVRGSWWHLERKRLFERAGFPKKGQLLDTLQGQSHRWIFRAKNVTYQKPPFGVA